MDRNYSQRRAYGLVGLEPKTYRYASKRPDDPPTHVAFALPESLRRRYSSTTVAGSTGYLGNTGLYELI